MQASATQTTRNALLITLSLMGFGLCIEKYPPIAFVLLAIAGALFFYHRNSFDLAGQFRVVHKKSFVTQVLIGIVIGLIIATAYRLFIGQAALPSTLTSFALLAILIGLTEEFIFRGLLYDILARHPIAFTVLFTAIAHTFYKGAIFLPFESVNIPFLVSWTFALGLILGYLRYRFDSLYPCLFFHSIFDLLTYGDKSSIPWWIW